MTVPMVTPEILAGKVFASYLLSICAVEKQTCAQLVKICHNALMIRYNSHDEPQKHMFRIFQLIWDITLLQLRASGDEEII